jgi:hypothetical protein
MTKIVGTPAKPPVFGPLKGEKSQDSLGNPASPGYDNTWGKLIPETKKEEPAVGIANNETKAADQEPKMVTGLRLLHGWETLLAAQKTICAKALKVLTALEAPQRYFSARRTKSVIKKVNGNILDFNAEEAAHAMAKKEAERAEQEKKSLDSSVEKSDSSSQKHIA